MMLKKKFGFKLLILAFSIFAFSIFLGTLSCKQRSMEATDDSAVSLKKIKIGSFNLRRLGQKGINKDMPRVARLIEKAGYQIFTGIEIMNPDGAQELLDALKAETGKKWEMELSPTATGETQYKEYFAYFYQPEFADLSNSKKTYCKWDGRAPSAPAPTCFADDNAANNKPLFERDPYVGYFKVGSATIAMVSVHLRYGGTSKTDVTKRQEELKNLREIMKNIKNSTPQTDVVALGDFNLYLTDGIMSTNEKNKKLVRMPDEFFEEMPTFSALVNEPTTTALASYDHIIYFNENKHKFEPGSEGTITDYVITNQEQRKQYENEVSDHFPIMAELEL